MQFPLSELVLNESGQVYHLGLLPENVSKKIILVGDQDRVAMISSFFEVITHKSQHREFVCHTGFYQNKEISVISTGIGTDNIDIVINELDALFNIDLKKREETAHKTQLEIVRIGTCGILQAHIPVHSFLLSSYAIGLDNVAHFYQTNYSNDEENILNAFRKQVELPKQIIPYCIGANQELFNRFISTRTYEGITITSSGFYGPQGRMLNLKTKTQQLNEQLSSFEFEEHQIINFEMESSALFALGKNLGHQCATVCLGVANRPKMEFSKGYNSEMLSLIQYVLERI